MKRGYKQTEIGEIPEEWSVVQIDSILELNGNSLRIGPFGSQLKKTLLVDSGYKVYGQENVFTNNFSIGNRFITPNHWELLKAFRVKPRDILVTMMGTIGKTTIVPDVIEDGIIDSHLIRISLNKRVVDNVFFIQQFSSPLVKKQLATLSVGGIMDGLSTKIIKKVFYSLPPLPEQKKIADVLSSVDESIRATQAVIEQAKILKQGMLNQLLTKGIGHKKFKQTEIGEIPEEWGVMPLDSLVDKVGSGITPKGGSKVYLQEGIPLIRSQNILMGKLDLSDVAYISDEQHKLMSSTKLLPNDVLLNITGASIGRSAVVPDSFREGNVNQHVCIIRPQHSISANYLMYFLCSSLGQKQIDSFQAGGNREGLNFQQIRKFIIPLPTVNEQDKIVTSLQRIDSFIESNENYSYGLERLKSGLMQDLLSGKKRVKV